MASLLQAKSVELYLLLWLSELVGVYRLSNPGEIGHTR